MRGAGRRRGGAGHRAGPPGARRARRPPPALSRHAGPVTPGRAPARRRPSSGGASPDRGRVAAGGDCPLPGSVAENATSSLSHRSPRGAVPVVGGHPTRSLQRAREDGGGPAAAVPCPHGHAAAVVGSHEQLLAAALPWLREGLAAGDLTVLSCDQGTAELLRDELGRPAGLVDEPRVSLRGVRPPDGVVAIRRLLDRAAEAPSGRLRILGAPDFGAAPRDWREAQRYESVLNRLLAGSPVEALCLYDQRQLPEQAAASASATHPLLLTGGVRAENPAYRRPGDYVRDLPLPREPLEQGEPVYAVAGAPTLADLRHQLAAVLAAQVPDREQREDLHLAVSEIAANAFRHGTPPVSARVWAADGWIVCTITDRGTSYRDELAGFQPAHGDDLSRGGMGLWLARKLWDHVDLLTGADGLTVRLSSPLH
nr:sensor histidine kinase [Modestobacter versicolor]